MKGLQGICTWAVALLCCNDASADRVARALYVNNVKEIGLRILTEANPKWSVQLEMDSKNHYTLRAQTPAHTYPAGEMVWTSVPELVPKTTDLHLLAYSAMLGSADRYTQVSARPKMRDLKAMTYGDLNGYEWSFSGFFEGTAMDVRMFAGHKAGKPLVVMQALAHQGKLVHLNEQVRRSWSNIRYLSDLHVATE